MGKGPQKDTGARHKGAGPKGPATMGPKVGSLVTIDDCAAFSRVVSSLLDELDPDQGTGPGYALEVSSPGLDRALKTQADFERFAGSLVKIRINQGGKASRHTGRLATGPLRVVTNKASVIAFELGEVISARLVPEI
ncbi:MAG: hypothetical protein LBU69_06840 [Deltaproteobacteria bacterium]|nr:hypothetical protein [Deltaproteobacteria bacterium]